MSRKRTPLELERQRFGELRVIGEAEPPSAGSARRVLCSCSCGRTCAVFLSNLLSGHTHSCGCKSRSLRAASAGVTDWPNAQGMRFGRMVVTRFVGPNANGTVYVECQCDCGTTKAVTCSSLQSGDCVSCGCKKVEQVRAMAHRHGEIVGGVPSPEYVCWSSMRSRCRDRGASGWNNYGERGIVVCDRWDRSFDAFLADMGRRPSAQHSIDRIDPNGNYEPSNCRWATLLQQRRSGRNVRHLTIFGERKPLVEWCALAGASRETVWGRVLRGMSHEDALGVIVDERCADAEVVTVAGEVTP